LYQWKVQQIAKENPSAEQEGVAKAGSTSDLNKVYEKLLDAVSIAPDNPEAK
jgi:hypothetical protein